ncbi:hypothetical protein KC19_VG042200 [Ceratodon purpureus]|uniref:Ribosomal protein L15 n=1 Tax=Ceratodon purpureus TaxID=3225 RepID=A0A8T0HLV3_CERPU|nr:hypothetical protein KC19_VG042200 [Ceratodon purpureus]
MGTSCDSLSFTVMFSSSCSTTLIFFIIFCGYRGRGGDENGGLILGFGGGLAAGAYKNIEELWRKKQSDVLRFLCVCVAGTSAQLPGIVHVTRPNRPDKARRLGNKAAVHSLLQAVQEIAASGEGRDRDVHVLVHRSIMRQSAPLKDSIRQELSTRDPSADDWLWRQQHPQAVASFVSILENDRRFTAVTSIGWEETKQ